MKKRQILWFCLAIFLLICFSFEVATAGNVRQQLTKESTLEGVLKRGVLKVGLDTFVPWAMRSKTGKLIGYEIDVATRLAEDMGVKVEFIPTKWSGIIPALLTGKFDVIIGGMGIRPERNLKVNFTIPYDYSGQSIMAHKVVAEGFDALDDFNNPGVTVVVKIGTTAAAAAKKFLPKAQIRLFDNESQAVQELLNGRAHAMIASAPLPAYQVIRNPDRLFLPLDDTFTKEPNGFALKKGDFDTLNFLNNWIRVVENEGWLKDRKHFWFKTKDWENQIH